ncbi:MAG: hypothetical protein WC213_06855 [Arenimonas sp.]
MRFDRQEDQDDRQQDQRRDREQEDIERMRDHGYVDGEQGNQTDEHDKRAHPPARIGFEPSASENFGGNFGRNGFLQFPGSLVAGDDAEQADRGDSDILDDVAQRRHAEFEQEPDKAEQEDANAGDGQEDQADSNQ